MKTFKKIGVIGGMGPEATALFMKRIISLTDARDDQDHVPLVVDMNPQIPSRLAALLDDGDISPVPTLAGMVKNLEKMGASALAMPCNTAHHYADEFMAGSNIPLLNMVELSAERISKLGIKDCRVGMLASPATDRFGIFQNIFDRYGLKAVFPENEDAVLSVIRRIKSEGVSPDLEGALATFVTELDSRGTNCLLIGCSEFSILAPMVTSHLPMFDSVDVLARAVVKFSGAKPRPQSTS